MLEFNFKIQYVKGKVNALADFLSQRPILNAMFLMKDIMLDTNKGFYENDVFFSI